MERGISLLRQSYWPPLKAEPRRHFWFCYINVFKPSWCLRIRAEGSSVGTFLMKPVQSALCPLVMSRSPVSRSEGTAPVLNTIPGAAEPPRALPGAAAAAEEQAPSRGSSQHSSVSHISPRHTNHNHRRWQLRQEGGNICPWLPLN